MDCHGYSCATTTVPPGAPIVPTTAPGLVELPVTGGETLFLALAGLALVIAGAALLIWIRHR